MSDLLPSARQKRQRAHIVGTFMIEQACRILSREAGVAELRLLVIAGGFADGTIKPFDGEEAERVDTDELGHFLDGHTGSQELRFFRCIDAVEAGRPRRR